MASESLLWVGAATRQKNIFWIHNCTCIAIGYGMRPINNSTLFVLASHAALSLRLRIRNTTCFKLETSHPPSQRTLFNLAQTLGNLATVWDGPYVNVFVVRNQHLESSIYSRVAWARTSIHIQEYGTRHQHDFHLTPYFLESVWYSFSTKHLNRQRNSNLHWALG